MQYRIRAGRQTVTVDETLLDRAVRYVDPVRARARMAARLQLAAAGGYTGAARSSRRLGAWKPGGGSADADLLPDLAALRERSRDLVRNAPLASGAINTVATNVVGTGLMPKAQPRRAILGWTEERAAAWKRTVEQEFAAWAECTACDATRTQSFYGLQDLAFRSALENGDCFALTPMIERPGVRYATAVQLIEGDRCSNLDGKSDTPRLAGGVALDEHGAPVAYHFRREHPGELRLTTRTWDVVPAFGAESGRRNVLHLYGKRRIGQTRGAPYLAPVIEAFKNLDRYTEAEIFAAVANAMFAIKVKTPEKTGLSPLESAVTGQTPGSTATDARESNWDGTLTAGLVVDLGQDEEVDSFTPGRPNAQFDPFVMAVLMQMGAALELPVEVLTKRFQSSYSAARGALLEAWKFYRNRRAWLAEAFCQPVWETWLAEAVARGAVDAPGFFADPLLRYAYSYATWHGDGPGSIDPAKEATAVEKRLQIHLSTLDQEIAEYSGGDAESTLEQAGREKAMREKHGLESPAPTAAGQGARPAGDDADKADDGEEDAAPPRGYGLTLNLDNRMGGKSTRKVDFIEDADGHIVGARETVTHVVSEVTELEGAP
ncbi:MAG: phage portal protein [Betaproteobacteria bacterium]|nr:MAG: phage portal protein [Betaproteobacteria bacterium]